MRMTDALTKRNQLKARKPAFLAQDTHKKKRIRQRWKRPRGLQSKVRLHKRGYRRSVSSGWRSPKAARGLSPEGLIPVRVENLVQLEALDPATHGAMVSGRVSIRTKKTLYDEAKKRSITILNRDAKVFEERYTAKMAERETRKKQLAAKRKRQEKLKKDIEETQKSGVAAEGLKEGTEAKAEKDTSKAPPKAPSKDAPEDAEESTSKKADETTAQAKEARADAKTSDAKESPTSEESGASDAAGEKEPEKTKEGSK